MLWKSFNVVITFIQQMHQINHPAFIALLRHIHTGSLTDTDVIILNSIVAKEFLLHDLLKNTVIVQTNKSKYMINRLQVEEFARHTSCNLIIFLAHHAHNRKNGGKSLIYHHIIKIQDYEYDTTGLGLLYYCKKMPYIVLANVCTPLEIVNGVTIIIYKVIPYLDGMLTVSRWNQ